jgi:murein DD-endopeptidase MepM/ murein hydrolase activator NlpD
LLKNATKSFTVLMTIGVVLSLWLPNFPVKSAFLSDISEIFSPPLGYSDTLKYGPRFTYNNGGSLIENTDYGIQNPDLNGSSTCFNTYKRLLLHAGEDWYREDGQSTAGAEVTAVANGTVYNINPGPYPGNAIVLEHHLPSGQSVYSVYMHIENVPSEITNGQPVLRGQKLGTVMAQVYDGLYPEYHPSSDDSHLHFEMRYFASAASIYNDHPACNKGDIAGRGYTYPGYPPDSYPNSSQHYTDPTTFIYLRAGLFLPLVIMQEQFCYSGQQLLANGGFESGSVGWVELNQPPYSIITNYLLPTPAYEGSWVAWFGGRDNATESVYQEFNVVSGIEGANLSYYIWIGTNETLPGAYDKFYVRLRDSNDNIIQQLDYVDNNLYEHTWTYRSTSLPDLSSRIGQTLRLSFDVITDGSNITSFLLDNASLTAVCNGLKSPQLPGQLVIPTNQPQLPTGDLEPTKVLSPTQLPYP